MLSRGRAGFGKFDGAGREVESAAARVIYFYHDEGAPLYLLMVYAKAEKEDLRPEEKRAVVGLTEILKKRARSERM